MGDKVRIISREIKCPQVLPWRRKELETLAKSIVSQPNDIFKDIKQSISILTVIRRYAGIELEQRGRDFRGLCPFHQERSPSFTVTPGKNMFYCFGCGTGGDAVAFVSQLHGLKPIEAAKLIAQDFGLTVDNRPLTREQRTRIRERQKQRELERALLEWATDSYIELAHLRRCLFYVLVGPGDFYEYPELVFLFQYVDHLLDVLSYGTLADKKALLELHMNDKLGLAGRWII